MATPASMQPSSLGPVEDDGLRVIALVSGGKDSFYSLLHCMANGHRVVALANLHPPLPPTGRPGPQTSAAAHDLGGAQQGETEAEGGEEYSKQYIYFACIQFINSVRLYPYLAPGC